jgi:hypothetical protein
MKPILENLMETFKAGKIPFRIYTKIEYTDVRPKPSIGPMHIGDLLLKTRLSTMDLVIAPNTTTPSSPVMAITDSNKNVCQGMSAPYERHARNSFRIHTYKKGESWKRG